MKVLMLLEGEFPPDERVEKEALTLINAGYQTEIFALSFSENKPAANYKGIKVYAPFVPKPVFKFFPALLVFPLYYWFRKMQFRKVVNRYDYQFIHVHDLPMSRMGLWLKKRCGAKLICDQHEYYSNWIGRTAHMNTFAGKIIGFLSRWERYERKYLNKADLVVTVSENLRDIYIKLHNISGENIISVPNTPLKNQVEAPLPVGDPALNEKYKDKFVLFYGGMIDILRGIDNIIRSLPYVIKEIPNVRVILAGRIRKGCDPMAVARSAGVGDFVEYVGFLNPHELRAYMSISSICFATSPADSIEVNNAISTKIYQYVSARKPILTGRATMMKELVTTYNSGMATDERDPEKIAGTIIQMSHRLSSFSFDIPESIMYWEFTSRILIEKYNDLC